MPTRGRMPLLTHPIRPITAARSSYESALCDAMTCPLVEGGDFELRVSQKLPVLAPPGSYTMEITGEDVGGVRFMCVAISFSVTMPPGPGDRRRAAEARDGPAGRGGGGEGREGEGREGEGWRQDIVR
ncbi:hypothetical protein GPECTOR_21g672 [Gonium pectorale]|uniref:MD-2-related lipid-recognition domain-containing protein n=1 Tax=Gonium pectorale TaxID=33097 RepID=A0A150GHX7_GONPE|nr:hypothetical protein GPECTOR_21g672 [Gonium pectorale]|eukprot:KXZ49446.1 hypothetical protein GPECTOR_21g672 [Gonium pectorale]